MIRDPKLSKVILTQHTTLLQERERMQKENEAYAKLQQLKTDRDADVGRLQKLKQEQFAIVSYRINEEMSRLNDAITRDLTTHRCWTSQKMVIISLHRTTQERV